jgi:hypothetical protein
MSTNEYLGYATQLLSDLGLLGVVTAIGVIVVAVTAFRWIANRNS